MILQNHEGMSHNNPVTSGRGGPGGVEHPGFERVQESRKRLPAHKSGLSCTTFFVTGPYQSQCPAACVDVSEVCSYRLVTIVQELYAPPRRTSHCMRNPGKSIRAHRFFAYSDVSMHTILTPLCVPGRNETNVRPRSDQETPPMKDTEKNKAQLIAEVAEMRGQVAALEAGRKEYEWVAEALKQSEAKFRKLTEQTVVGAYLIQDDLFRYVNPKMAHIFGYEVDELIHRKGPADLVFPEDRPLVEEHLKKRITGQGQAVNFEFQGIRRDRSVIHVEVHVSRTDYEGRPAIIGTLVDVTQRVKTELELRDSESRHKALYEESKMREELYRSLLNSSADAIVIYDMEGKAQYVNPSFERIFGWTLEDVQGRRIQFVPEAEQDSSMAIITQLMQQGTPCTGFQTKRFTKDGRFVDVSISASRYHDHHGDPVGMLTILRDISDATRVQEELRKSREEYRALYVKSERLQKHYLTMLEDSPEPIVVYDVVGVPVYINPAFSRVFGWTFDELKGRRIDFVPPENRPETKEMIDKVLSGEAFFGRETRRYTKSGATIDVSVSGAVFFDETGARTGSVVHLRDIGEQKRAEAKLAAELRKFQALYDLALAMIAQRSLDENISLVVDKVREILGVDKAYIALRDEATNELYMHTLSGIVTPEFKHIRIPMGVGLGGEVARTGKSCVVEDYFQEVGPAFHDIVRAEGFLSGMAVPVQIGNTNLGVLYAFNCSRTKFSRADLDSLALLGNLAAVEITRKRVQEQLREREESFRALYEESKRREELYVSLLNSSADAIVIYDMEGRAQYVNPSFTRTFGWTADEVTGQKIPFLPESEREATMAVIQGLLRDGTPCSAFETKRFAKDGHILDVSISASRTLDHEGKIAGTLAILRNISDRKRAEAAIRESEERFRTLTEMAPFGLVVATGDERTEYVNPKFTDIFGYTIEDMPNASAWFARAYPSAMSSSKAAAVWRAEAAEIKRKYGIGREAAPRVFRAVCKDGSEKTVSFRAVLLEEGRLIATFVDVTAEAKAQQEIVRAKNEWERTFNSVSDLIVIVDQDQKIVRMNKALADRLGAAAEDLIGSDCRQDRGLETTPAVLCPGTGTSATGREYSAEVVDERLGGVFDLRVSPLTDEQGRLIGSVNVARDITALKAMERARRRAVHHLSHELKTPLAVIKSTVKYLGQKQLSEADKAERIDRIRRNLKRLTDIQEIVQEIAAPRAYNPTRFALVPAIHGLVEEVGRASAHRSVELVPRLELIETDIIDAEIFADILHTLIKNAIENTPDEGEVFLYLTQVPAGVLLQVEDKGVGISASDKEFVFKAFYHTQATSRYATRNPFDFNAGGKGLELMRLKILSEACPFEISFQSRRCHYMSTHRYDCPGRVSLCEHAHGIEDCRKSGGSTFSVLFHGAR